MSSKVIYQSNSPNLHIVDTPVEMSYELALQIIKWVRAKTASEKVWWHYSGRKGVFFKTCKPKHPLNKNLINHLCKNVGKWAGI